LSGFEATVVPDLAIIQYCQQFEVLAAFEMSSTTADGI
jgi:hypothetical protein